MLNASRARGTVGLTEIYSLEGINAGDGIEGHYFCGLHRLELVAVELCAHNMTSGNPGINYVSTRIRYNHSLTGSKRQGSAGSWVTIYDSAANLDYRPYTLSESGGSRHVLPSPIDIPIGAVDAVTRRPAVVVQVQARGNGGFTGAYVARAHLRAWSNADSI